MTDWKVGDEAVCVKSAERTFEGRVYTIKAICPPGRRDEDGFLNDTNDLHLRFEELPKRVSYWSSSMRFRKVVRDKQEKCEPEFVTLLKRSKVSA